MFSLVTLPLIEISGHVWELWFACDTREHIDLCGPIVISSTSDIVATYALVRSLQARKEWVETEFYAGMKTWFMVDVAAPAPADLAPAPADPVLSADPVD